MSFSPELFQKLKTHVAPGTLGLGVELDANIRVIVSDNTSYGRGWELRIHDVPASRMLILTEKDGVLTPQHCRLSPHPSGSGYEFHAANDPAFEARAAELFVASVDFLERRRAEEAEANRIASEKLRAFACDPAAMQRWRDLVGILVEDPARADKLVKSTHKAFTSPEGFLKRLHAQRISDDFPWLALVAALKKEKLLFEFDWRQDPQKEAAQRGLPAAGRILVVLDTGGDSHPTAQLDPGQFEVAVALAASFGWRIQRSFK